MSPLQWIGLWIAISIAVFVYFWLMGRLFDLIWWISGVLDEVPHRLMLAYRIHRFKTWRNEG